MVPINVDTSPMLNYVTPGNQASKHTSRLHVNHACHLDTSHTNHTTRTQTSHGEGHRPSSHPSTPFLIALTNLQIHVYTIISPAIDFEDSMSKLQSDQTQKDFRYELCVTHNNFTPRIPKQLHSLSIATGMLLIDTQLPYLSSMVNKHSVSMQWLR